MIAPAAGRRKPARAYTNILKLRLNKALRREVITNYPVIAYIEPTLFCSLRCPACPTGQKLNLRPAALIDEKLFHSAIDELGDYLFQLHMYNWGEPLLHKQTPELIGYAKSKNIRVTLSTHFSIPLSDDYLERLVLSGLDALTVSLDGASQETYERYRKGGDLALVRDNMKRLQEHKRRLQSPTPHVSWQFLAFRHNEHEIETAKKEYREWGADSIAVLPPFMSDDPAADGLEPSTDPRYSLDTAMRSGARKSLARTRPCSWLYGAVVLNPNAKVSPCCASPDEKDDFGEYSPALGFRAVWNSVRYRRARSLRPQAGPADDEAAGAAIQRISGAGVRTSGALEPDALICQSCPMVWWQDMVEKAIEQIAYSHASRFLKSRQFRDFASLLLMGLPPLAMLGRRVLRVFR